MNILDMTFDRKRKEAVSKLKNTGSYGLTNLNENYTNNQKSYKRHHDSTESNCEKIGIKNCDKNNATEAKENLYEFSSLDVFPHITVQAKNREAAIRIFKANLAAYLIGYECQELR